MRNEKFQEVCSRNYGTTQYFRVPYSNKFVYTDGIQDFIETFDAYWFRDMVVSYLPDIVSFAEKNLYNSDVMTTCTMGVYLVVEGNKAKFDVRAYGYDNEAEDEKETVIVKQDIHFTDLEDGEYDFFLGADLDRDDHIGNLVLMLVSEY